MSADSAAAVPPRPPEWVPPAPPVVPPTPPAPGKRRRNLLRFLVALTAKDAVVVLLIAVAMSLSAYAVYQATRAADDARSLFNDARTGDAAANRQSAQLQSLIDNDLRVLALYCEAKVREDAAWVGVLAYDSDIESLVTSNLLGSRFVSLLQGDYSGDCEETPEYSVANAVASMRDSTSSRAAAPAAPGALVTQAGILGGAEVRLMVSGALFAFAVAVLIAIEVLRSRRHRAIRDDGRVGATAGTLAILWPAALLGGGALLATASVDTELTLTVLAVAALLLVVGLWRAMRREPRPPQPVSPRIGRIAQLAGAGVLVLFTIAALGFSYLGVQEREANARADAAATAADLLQSSARQEAMRDLADVATMARLDGEGIAQLRATEGQDGAETAEQIDARISDVSSRIQQLEDGVRVETRALLRERTEDVCAARTEEQAPSSWDLYHQVVDDPSALSDFVWAGQQPSRICDVDAMMTRDEARAWAADGSVFTVCLVLLGLSAFIVALAGEGDRSRSSAWVLLGVGGASALVAVTMMLFTVPDIVRQGRGASPDDVKDFATAFADGWDRPCGSADGIRHALEIIPSYGPAYEALAYSRDCRDDPFGLTATPADVDLDAVIGDLEHAVALGPGSPTLTGNLG
ncbi:hypothetical protein ACH3VR_09300 [Microbacterium sp. B2969]|uniref:DUF4239 domain-containing protein n=1 Tax=Microbacterium alkaliflavum TaxID=3248839 RepID=A0ABW7QAK4_9MICO